MGIGERHHGSWIVRCEGLVEHRVALGQRGGRSDTRRHELLIDHQEAREELVFYGGVGAISIVS